MKTKPGLKVHLVRLGICIALAGCSGGGSSEPVRMSAEQQCAQLSNGFGHAFFCGTSQGNLNTVSFQDGSLGFCMFANENIGLVGYSAVTNRGGAFFVTTQANASNTCSLLAGNPFPDNCTTYIRCTRI
jgi:hypothetical protein